MYALNILKDKRLITKQEYVDVVSLFKLRNLLVHRYWIIDDEKICHNVERDFKNIVNFIERVISNG